MTDHRKIPVPGQPDETESATGGGDSLFERAAGRFDFNSFLSKPVSVSEDAPARRFPVKPTEAEAAPAPVAPPVPAARSQPAFEAPVAAARPIDEPADEPFFAPAVFHGEALPVDRDHLREQGLIVPEGTVTELLEEFRIVKRQLLVQAADLRRQKAGAMAQRILISSPHPGEGKTYCALNLALSIAAEKESEVLLVDADFAKPSILSALGLPGGPGLMDALMDESIDPADCVLGTDIPGLWVLPAGDTTSHDSEYLSSSRTGRVLERLTAGAPQRIVIFDSPPALSASPAAELAKYVGQTVVIVRADKTGRGSLDDAISLLGACPNVQLLLNAAQFSPSGRRFGSYYGYRG